MIDTVIVATARTPIGNAFRGALYSVHGAAQDEVSLLSQQRTAQAQAAGRFDGEIVPITTSKMSTTERTA